MHSVTGAFCILGIELQSFLLQPPPASLVCSSSSKSHTDPSSHLWILLSIQILTSALDQSLGNYCVHSLCNLALCLPLPSPRNKYSSKLQLLLPWRGIVKKEDLLRHCLSLWIQGHGSKSNVFSLSKFFFITRTPFFWQLKVLWKSDFCKYVFCKV